MQALRMHHACQACHSACVALTWAPGLAQTHAPILCSLWTLGQTGRRGKAGKWGTLDLSPGLGQGYEPALYLKRQELETGVY